MSASAAPVMHPGSPTGPARARFGRRKWDKQPEQSSAVLIATIGIPVPASVIRQAVALSGGSPVAVVTIARIYGSALGLPNPGLMPTKKEMAEHQLIVRKAVSQLERAGVEAWGQVAATRRFAKTIAGAARARGVDHVLVIAPETAHWRQVVEGDVAKEVGRRLDGAVVVEGITV